MLLIRILLIWGGKKMRIAMRVLGDVRQFFLRRVARVAAVGQHLQHDGYAVAVAALLLPIRAQLLRRRRDPGERAAERFLRALGYSIVARNWRSPRDRRDEADLVALTPCGTTLVVVEVKRSNSGWNALDRIDPRKREVLWRLVRDLESLGLARVDSARASDARLIRIIDRGVVLRVDAIGVQGQGSTAIVTRHSVGIYVRRKRRSRPSIPLRAQHENEF